MSSASSAHGPRREPATPLGPTDLGALGDELLAEARTLASGRTARTLTPGAGAALKQTLLALQAGAALQDHVAPGPATLLAVTGTVALTQGDERHELSAGQWLPIPSEIHGLEAVTDAVALITVAPR